MNLIDLTTHHRAAVGKSEWNPNMAAHPPADFAIATLRPTNASFVEALRTANQKVFARGRGAAEKSKCFETAVPHHHLPAVLRLFSFALKQLPLLLRLQLQLQLQLLFPSISHFEWHGCRPETSLSFSRTLCALASWRQSSSELGDSALSSCSRCVVEP